MNQSTLAENRLSNDLTMYNTTLTRWFQPSDRKAKTKKVMKQSFHSSDSQKNKNAISIVYNDALKLEVAEGD
jgi:hypothetical protein